MTRDRTGFTMVEMLVVTVLGLVVLMAAMTILITNQRTYTAQNAVIQGQQATRMALEVLMNELREVSPSGGDILVMSSDSLRVRLMRKFSLVCENWDGSGQPQQTVLNLPGRRFESGDSVFVFADNNPRNDDDDAWISASVSGVDTTATCPAGERGTIIRFNGQAALFNADSVGVGAPVRSFDRYTFGLVTYSGAPYLGRRQGTGDMTPVVGPLRAGTGVEFGYRNAMGHTTATAGDVQQIVVTVRTGSGVLNSVGNEVADSITTWVYTRN